MVSGNQIVMGGSGASKGGILLHGVGGVDVIANRIAYEGPSGDAYGISLTSAAATPTVRILDNLVTRASQSFGAAGIAVSDMSGAMSLEIANNTIDSSAYGISLGIEGATAGSVANNIITSSSSAGLGITNSGSGTVSNHHNLFFENQFDVIGSKAGAASIFGDPHYAGPGDYHLQSGSPARDAGDDGSVPVDLTTDLDGNPRVQGSHVDLGAYETAAEPSVGIAAPASLSALAALALRRRR